MKKIYINELILCKHTIKMSVNVSEELIELYSKQNIDNSIELAFLRKGCTLR